MTKSLDAVFRKVRKDAIALKNAEEKVIIQVLHDLADLLEEDTATLLKANSIDVAKKTAGDPKIDRLILNEARIKDIAFSIRKVAELEDPTGKVVYRAKTENGLDIEKITVPLGVVGVIYESRPNVTFDVATLCLRSRNVCLLKGSSDAENTNHAALILIKKALRQNNLPVGLVTLLPSERSAVQELMDAHKYVDVIIPRGSAELINYVRSNSRIPVIETGAGVCHTYVHSSANIQKAVDIIINAKVDKPAACNALDTILVDKNILDELLEKLVPQLEKSHIGIWADATIYKKMKGFPFLNKATDEDWNREYLSLNAGIKMVKDIDAALEHIEEHSTKHSEAIIAEDAAAIQQFLNDVDAAAVYSNASTRFTDGGVFQLGAEIGISTQKLHARGPFALEKLITEKWVITGNGQTR